MSGRSSILSKRVPVWAPLIVVLMTVSFLGGYIYNQPRTTQKSYFERKIKNEISAYELKRLIDENGSYQLIDVRRTADAENGFIRSAELIPYWQISRETTDHLDKDELTIVYCYTWDCIGEFGFYLGQGVIDGIFRVRRKVP